MPRISRHDLENRLRNGEAIRLETITMTKGGVACTLYPYQEEVEERFPESARINKYLYSSGYRPRESHWAVVIANSEGIEISEFKRSRNLDILAPHELLPEDESKLAQGFKATECSPMDTAAVTKISIRGRSYVVMGELK